MSKVFTLSSWRCSPNMYYRVISLYITVGGVWSGTKDFEVANPAHTTIITIDSDQEHVMEDGSKRGNIIFTKNTELQLFYNTVKSEPHTAKDFYISDKTRVKTYDIGTNPEIDIAIATRLF